MFFLYHCVHVCALLMCACVCTWMGCTHVWGWVYTYMCLYAHVCADGCAHMCAHCMCVHACGVYTCMCLCTRVQMVVCMCVWIGVHVCAHVCGWVCACGWVCTHVCVHCICVCICVCVDICVLVRCQVPTEWSPIVRTMLFSPQVFLKASESNSVTCRETLSRSRIKYTMSPGSLQATDRMSCLQVNADGQAGDAPGVSLQ